MHWRTLGLDLFLGAVLLAGGLTGVFFMQKKLVPYKDRMPSELFYIPSPRFAKVTAFGFSKAAADLHWIRSIQYFHREITAEDRTGPRAPLYGRLIRLITELDPDFHNAYYNGSILLSLIGRIDEAEEILLLGKGRHEGTSGYDLEIGKLLRFTPRQPDETEEGFADRRSRAMDHFNDALGKDDLSSFNEVFLRRIFIQTGDWKTAFEHFERRFRKEKDRAVRRRWGVMLRQTAIEPVMMHLRQAIARYRHETGDLPPTLEALTTKALPFKRSGKRGSFLLYRTPPFGRAPIADFRDTLYYDPVSGRVRSEFLFLTTVSWFRDQVAFAQERFLKHHGRFAHDFTELLKNGGLRAPGTPLFGSYRLDDRGRLEFVRE